MTKKEKTEVWLLLAFIVFTIFAISFFTGYARGYEKHMEDEERWTCEVNNRGKTINEIPLECLQILDLKQK